MPWRVPLLTRSGLRRSGLAGVLVAFVAFVGAFGRVTAVELSPRTLEHRSVVYYRVPFLELRVTPRWTRAWRSPLAEHLLARGLVDPASADDEPGWVLVNGFAREVRGWHGPARRLCQELGCSSGDDGAWVGWSASHPDVAAELWPYVVASAREADLELAALALRAARPARTVAEYRFMLELAHALDDDGGSHGE